MIVSTIYTTNEKAYKQALKASKQWNSKSATIDGYNVVFNVLVMQPSEGNFTKSQLSNKRARFAAAVSDKNNSRVGTRILKRMKTIGT